MKNFIFACVAVTVLIIGTAVSSVTVRRYTEETLALIEDGKSETALELFDKKKDTLSLVVNGCELERLEVSLIDLVSGTAGAKEKAISICKELASRERIGWNTLF